MSRNDVNRNDGAAEARAPRRSAGLRAMEALDALAGLAQALRDAGCTLEAPASAIDYLAARDALDCAMDIARGVVSATRTELAAAAAKADRRRARERQARGGR